jgi:hypothetical protein
VAALALSLLIPLALARWLEPDVRGYGTHQQFGLPPCTFLVLFGWRCPSCGMTTAWANLVRGRLVAALATHVTGTILGVLDLAAAVWLGVVAWRGRWLVWTPNSTVGAWWASLIALVILIEWGLRLLAG